MIKASGADWRHIAQPALHLVGDGQGSEKLTALPSCILSRRQHRRQIVARMTGLVLGEVTVIKIEITDECSIEQGCPIGRGSSASDQSTVACSSEVINLLANQPHRLCLECADRTAKRIQNSDLELQPRRFGEIVEGSSHNKCCQPLSVCHICLSPAWSLKSMLRWMLGLFLDETTTCASDKPI